MSNIDFEKRVPEKWGWFKLKGKSKKFLNMKRKYIKRYGKRLTDEATKELTDNFNLLKSLIKSKDKDRKVKLRQQLIKCYQLLDRYLPDTVDRPVREFIETFVSALIIVFFLRAFLVDTYHIPTGSMIPTIMPGDRIFASKFIWGFSIPWMNVKFFEWNHPQKGDIIIFEPPQNKDPKFLTVSGIIDNFVKRMLADEGDTYEIKDNVIYINGKPIKRKLIKEKFYFDDRDHQNNQKSSVGTLYLETLGTHTYTTVTTNGPLDYFGADKDGNITVKPLKAVKPYKIPNGSYFLLSDLRDITYFDSRFFGPLKRSEINKEKIEVGDIVTDYKVTSQKVNLPSSLPPLRIVAKGGDEIEIKNKKLYINGKNVEVSVDESIKKLEADSGVVPVKAYFEEINNIKYHVYWLVSMTANFGVDEDGKTSFFRIDMPQFGMKKIVGPYKVPKGYCFATGDNRDGSADSRFWGPVPKNNIKGTPMIIWLSTNNWVPRFNRFFKIFYGK